MADDLEDDQWLYGDSVEGATGEAQSAPLTEERSPQESQNFQPALLNPVLDDGPPGVDTEEKENQDLPQQQELSQENQDDGMEDGEVRQNGDDSDKDDEEDSDDDVNVVIGDIKTTAPSYTQLNIKRGGLISTVGGDKSKQGQQQQTGKFSVDEFEQIGTINGIAATDYNLDSLEDKPWRKPGADITDYFNYGFNEDTWRAYCERQKRMRVNESGVGLIPMNNIGMSRGPIPIMNDNSKYTGSFLGGTAQRQVIIPIKADTGPKMNTIQVMTADRREYSRKPAFPDVTVPPPGSYDAFQPEYGFNPEPEPFYGGYEPTQDCQWGNEPPPGWQPSELKTLTGPPPMGPPPIMGPPPVGPMRSPRRDSPHREGKERDKDRDRESRSRSEKPRERDRERERSHRRERSRSRSRRHNKSRSRSPSHRSHRKKKSRRHEDSE